MLTYLIRQFIQTLIFILLAWLVLYTVLIYLMPGGPANRYSAVTQDRAFRNTQRLLEQQYSLDKPWPLSFLGWLYNPDEMTDTVLDENDKPIEITKGIDFTVGPIHLRGSGMLTGDFGRQERVLGARFIPSQPVADAIGARWVNTVTMIGLAFIIAVLAAIPIGIIAAVRQGTLLDNTLTFATFTGFSIPPFMLGLLMAIIFGILPYQFRARFGWEWLPYFPGALASSSLDLSNNLADRLYHLVLPVATLALPQIALLSRHVRFSMLEIIGQDYIRTAWAKGLSARRVILRHTFRNALIPIITTVGLIMPVLLTGAVMVESVFGYPGMGQLYFKALGGCLATGTTGEGLCPPGQALLPLDYPMTLALTIMMIAAVAFANMIADIFYTFADPRINYKTL